MAQAGIKRVINGPFTFSPDGNPLVGPVQGLPGFWCACAVMAGFSQGGGVGLALSQWIVNGDPGFDVWAMDVARYGEWATRSYTNTKVRENYSRRFSIRFPNEELPAARPQQTTALYDLHARAGRGHGRQLGPGDRAVVRPPGRGAEGHRLVPPLQRLRAREGGVPGRAQRRGRHRDRQLCEVRDRRPGRGGLPVAPDDQPHAAPGPPGAHARCSTPVAS